MCVRAAEIERLIILGVIFCVAIVLSFSVIFLYILYIIFFSAVSFVLSLLNKYVYMELRLVIQFCPYHNMY